MLCFVRSNCPKIIFESVCFWKTYINRDTKKHPKVKWIEWNFKGVEKLLLNNNKNKIIIVCLRSDAFSDGGVCVVNASVRRSIVGCYWVNIWWFWTHCRRLSRKQRSPLNFDFRPDKINRRRIVCVFHSACSVDEISTDRITRILKENEKEIVFTFGRWCSSHSLKE